MNKLAIVLTILLLSSIAGNAQNTNPQNSEKINKIQTQIDALQKQIEANPCYVKSGAKTCQQKDYDKYQPLLQQKKSLEDAKRAEQTKLTTRPPTELEQTLNDAGTVFSYVIAGVAVIGAFALIGLFIWLIFRSPKLPESKAHGSARFASENELIEAHITRAERDLDEGEFYIGGISKELDAVLPQERTSRHVYIVGSTGSGKTYSTIMPNILFSRNESLFISDVKDSELWRMTSGYKKNSIRLDPMNPRLNMSCFNWIPLLKDDVTKAKTFASAVIYSTIEQKNAGESVFWYETARDLLAAIWMHTAATDHPTPLNAYQLLMSKRDVLADVLENSDVFDARTLARNYLDSPEKTSGGMLSTARNACAFMQQKEIQHFTNTRKESDFSVMREVECATYYQAPYEHEKLLKPLNCLFLTYLFQQLKEKKGLTVKFILDEFANFGRIPNFENEITLLRSKKMPVIACVQTLKSQLEGNYGRTATETILGNFNTKIAFAGLENNSTEAISRALGKFTMVQEKVSNTNSGFLKNSSTSSIQEHGRELMTADEITRMDKKQLLVFHCGELHPFIAWRITYDTPEKAFAIEEQKLRELDTPPSYQTSEKAPAQKKKQKQPMPEFPSDPDFPDIISG